MPSRLSSLLVRDGLLGVKRMEKAFQRQVIYGGSLDTILLEMALATEDRLTQYLALASGLPPAARDELAPAEHAATIVSRALAERYRVVPVSADGEAVRILVCAPLELVGLEDLADALDRPLQPLITPEYRWHLAFAAAYGLEPAARFATLARMLDVDPSIPVGKSPTGIGDAPGSAPADEPPRRAKTPSARRPTLPGVEPNRAGDSRPPPLAAPEPPSLSKPAPAPISTEGRDDPMTIARAREVLATADDRDTVFLTLLRAARSRARWAGLLTVQSGVAIGRVALGEPGLDVAAIHTVSIPLDAVPAFRTVVANRQPHIGPLVTGDPSIDPMLVRLGGTMPPRALLLPVVLRDRVVAIVVAHRVQSDIRLADVTELLPIATASSDALGRLIVKHKAAGYRAPVEPPAIEIEVRQIDTKPIFRIAADDDAAPHAAAAWSAPVAPPAMASFEQRIATDAQPARPIAGARRIDDCLDDIERDPEHAEPAIAEAVERANETLGALARRFPGRLRVAWPAVAQPALRAAQYGGLLGLVIRLGAVASELLIENMTSGRDDVRFFATLCCAELRPRNAVFALGERLFDRDLAVRSCAIGALAGYPPDDLAHALVRVRRAVHATDPDAVGAATAALVALGDAEAVADLIGVIERADRGGGHARAALIALTAQDFGPSEDRWRAWYDAARVRHRIEWLIEGLAHADPAIRETAIGQLRRATGEDLGYHHELPAAERRVAAARWATWWRDVGRQRFGA